MFKKRVKYSTPQVKSNSINISNIFKSPSKRNNYEIVNQAQMKGGKFIEKKIKLEGDRKSRKKQYKQIVNNNKRVDEIYSKQQTAEYRGRINAADQTITNQVADEYAKLLNTSYDKLKAEGLDTSKLRSALDKLDASLISRLKKIDPKLNGAAKHIKLYASSKDPATRAKAIESISKEVSKFIKDNKKEMEQIENAIGDKFHKREVQAEVKKIRAMSLAAAMISASLLSIVDDE